MPMHVQSPMLALGGGGLQNYQLLLDMFGIIRYMLLYLYKISIAGVVAYAYRIPALFLWYWGLNSRLHVCRARGLLLKPCLQPFSVAIL
jgi:hypothetical protein